MHTPSRSVQSSFVLSALCMALVGCDGSGSNAHPAARLFFGTSNIAPCNPITIRVDLQHAEAVLARLGDGSVDCVLNTLLSNQGCSVAFDEIDGGDTLRVTIDQCEVPAISNLFQCGFESADLAALETSTSAECECARAPLCITNGSTCFSTPGICVNPLEDPHACELCTNSIDDDGNGLTDCNDPNCYEECGVGQTTVTCTSTTTTIPTTTSTLDTPTTTIPPTTTLGGAQNYVVRFHLDTASAGVGALQWGISYAAAPGGFEGSGASVACTNKVSGALFAPNDLEGNHKLALGLVALTPFTAPLDLADCVFNGNLSDPPVPGDFTITVEDSTDGDGGAINATISASVTVAP